jgi:hypothetical protein
MRSDRFAKQIECLDISLFSSLIGYAASGRDVGESGVAFADEFAPLHARARDVTFSARLPWMSTQCVN